MATQVVMPLLGESVVEGTVARWLKKVGETVRANEPLVEVETDKVNTEIPSPADGVILKLVAAEGDVVKVGQPLALIGERSEAGAPAGEPAQAASQPAPAQPSNGAIHGHRAGGNGGPRVSPLVANIAAQHGIDVSRIPGTGEGGRVTKKDILSVVESRQASPARPSRTPEVGVREGSYPAPLPAGGEGPGVRPAPPDHVHSAPPAPGKPGELVRLSSMRKRIAEHMVLSKLKTAPHVTTVFEADLSAVMAHREAHKDEFAARGVNLTFTAYFMQAAARALIAHPMVNSQWTDEGVMLMPEVNIGMAVAIDDGLIVPVVRRVDELALLGISRAVNDLANRARSSQLKPDEVQGGTFTITNHGVSGSLFATPIINQPQTGILGVGAIQKRVVVLDGDVIAIRPMIYLTLTFDHRVLDGASADFFMADVKRELEGWKE